MAVVYSPLALNVVDDKGIPHTLVRGRNEVPDHVADHWYSKGAGVKREADLTDEDRRTMPGAADVVIPSVIDNRPQSDVDRAGMADARELVAAGSPQSGAAPLPIDQDVRGIAVEKPVRGSSEDKGSPIPGPKPGR